MGEEVGFTNCVFEKLWFSENTIFIVFSAKHSFSKTKTVCWKKRKFMNNCGLFLNMAEWCFLGLFFEVLMLLWFVFGVIGIVPEVLKMLVFPVWGAFVGWLILLYFGFGRFRCFRVSCVCFCLLCWFCFCFVCFVFVWLLDCFGVRSCFALVVFFFFCFCFFVLCFLEGLRVRWGGSKGHLTWP